MVSSEEKKVKKLIAFLQPLEEVFIKRQTSTVFLWYFIAFITFGFSSFLAFGPPDAVLQKDFRFALTIQLIILIVVWSFNHYYITEMDYIRKNLKRFKKEYQNLKDTKVFDLEFVKFAKASILPIVNDKDYYERKFNKFLIQ